MRLDYSITNPQERLKYINNLLTQSPHWSSRDLQKMADYLIFSCTDHKGEVLTDNRMVTINRRETSFQGLAERLEGGEDALHSLVREDKQTILTPKNTITESDLAQIPDLRRLRERIKHWEERLAQAQGRERYKIKKMLIEMRKEQYAIKNLFRSPMYTRTNIGIPMAASHVDELRLDQPVHVSEILNQYARLKHALWDDLHNDMRWMLIDLEAVIDQFIKARHPIYYDILVMKVDGDTNEEIQYYLQVQYGKEHSQEYISSLWRNKIPELIADGYREHFLNWVYTYRMKGLYKTCSRCNQTKLAHRRYFGTNQAAKYGFYSVCKECRNKKTDLTPVKLTLYRGEENNV
jgi:hypothetical protein